MAELNIGIDLGGRKISASSLPSSTVFSEDAVVLRTQNGNYIREYPYTSSISHLDVFYNGESFSSLFAHNNTITAGTYYDVTLPDDFGVVTEVNEESVSYPHISREPNGKTYAFSEDLNKVELNGTALYPDVLFDGDTLGSVTLSASAADYSHMRIYFHTDDNLYSSVDVYRPNGKSVYLMSGISYSSGNTTHAYLKAKSAYINGHSIVTGDGASPMNLRIYPSMTYTKKDVIYIRRVEAWN